MKYKLIKPLNREQLRKTKWRNLDKEKSLTLVEHSIKVMFTPDNGFDHRKNDWHADVIIFGKVEEFSECTTVFEQEFWDSYSDFKEMKFDDYFDSEDYEHPVEKELRKKITEKDLINYNAQHPDPLDEIFVESHHKEGTFMWAVDMMKQGKKVKIKSIRNKLYHLFASKEKGEVDFIYLKHSNELEPKLMQFNLEIFSAIDWEIYEENKFGKFKVGHKGSVSFGRYSIDKKHFKDLKRAIKYAEDSRNE